MGRDLLFFARVADAAERTGAAIERVDSPEQLPPVGEVGLVIVDWADRAPDWGDAVASWRSGAVAEPPRIVLYGPHTDLDAHAAARATCLGPMWARSKLVSGLDDLFGVIRHRS